MNQIPTLDAGMAEDERLPTAQKTGVAHVPNQVFTPPFIREEVYLMANVIAERGQLLNTANVFAVDIPSHAPFARVHLAHASTLEGAV